MIVDDNPDILEALEQLLIAEGLEVITAGDGIDALAALHHGKIPCVIFLDSMMPFMNGVQFLSAIRKDAKLATIPVYVISASGDFDGAAGEVGIRGFIHKPFDPKKLLEIVRRHL
jgi:chemosensory pili system protein ChpA (sensor histidine kinase/response regulator)